MRAARVAAGDCALLGSPFDFQHPTREYCRRFISASLARWGTPTPSRKGTCGSFWAFAASRLVPPFCICGLANSITLVVGQDESTVCFVTGRLRERGESAAYPVLFQELIVEGIVHLLDRQNSNLRALFKTFDRQSYGYLTLSQV